MKHLLPILIVGLIFSFYGCQKDKVSQDAVQLSVDFTWEGMKTCGWGNPEIQISGVPDKTKFLKISMYDHVYRHDHGTILAPYTGDGIIARDKFKKIQQPCPPFGPGRYKITIKAIDEKDIVIGIGSKERMYPEKE